MGLPQTALQAQGPIVFLSAELSFLLGEGTRTIPGNNTAAQRSTRQTAHTHKEQQGDADKKKDKKATAGENTEGPH